MNKKVENKSKFRETVTYQAILLGASTLVATTLLSFGNLVTKDEIALRIEEDLKASISQVVPDTLYDNDLLASTITEENSEGESVLVYQATRNNAVTAVIFEVSENGYSGEIRSIIAIGPDGRILGVRILSHSETPGLGDKIEVQKDDWVLGFDGLSINNPSRSGWAVRKDGGEFDQFTGATITPRAVVKSIRSGLEFFEEKKQELLHVNTESQQ
ncbi:MAG TPA: electron transport complex subunit RsxG [Woeseiaceae bacterium]|nr:electron transport complex subunit RsxG [Woeseiaceae bacterium]